MIIERKYEQLGKLYQQDELSKKLIDEVLETADISEELKERIFNYNFYNIPAYFTMGCGFPGESYKQLLDGLEALDKQQTYDNGLTFKDVTDIEFETSRKGIAIQMRFIMNSRETGYRIIGFVSIENKNDVMKIGKGWRMNRPSQFWD